MPGSRLLGGRYEITRHLHTGRVTHTYEGIDRDRELPVVIEVLRGVGSQEAARLKAAGEAAARLTHPNLTRVITAEQVGELAYLVREPVPGPALSEVLAREGRLAPERASTIAVQICDALGAAHRNGLVHGDLTLSHIFVVEGGAAGEAGEEVKLSGLGSATGLAAPGDRSERTSAVADGPLQPASDRHSDLYALGSCLYEMLLGRAPFAGDPQLLDRIGSRIPSELSAVLRRLLAVDPRDRYQDVPEVRSDLERYLTPTRTAEEPAEATDGPPSRSLPQGTASRGSNRDTGSAVSEAGRRSLDRSAFALAAVGVLLTATVGLTAHQFGVTSELVVGSSGGPGRPGDLSIGSTSDDDTDRSGTGTNESSDAPSTTQSSSTTTTDPDDEEEDDEDEEEGDTDEDEEPAETEEDGEGSTVAERPGDDDSGSSSPSTTSPGSPGGSPSTTPATTAPPQATVPNVVGMTENDAANTLAAHGLGMASQRVRASPSQDGIVLSQSPGGGAAAPASGTVSVDVGRYCFLVC